MVSFHFTLEEYRRFLASFISAGYMFKRFTDHNLSDPAPYILLRHDIDFDLDTAVVISDVESKLNVTATYFFQLRSPLYNSLTSLTRDSLTQIHMRNHSVALHIDLSNYDAPYEDAIQQEIGVAKIFFPFLESGIVSFHRPGPYMERLTYVTFGNGIEHTYEAKFFSQIQYFSDSRCQWGYGYPLESEAFLEKKPMQIVVHPLWWVINGKNANEKLQNYVFARYNQTIDYIEKTAVSFSLRDIKKITHG